MGPFGFPDGGAAARRVLGNAKSLTGAGYRVVVASGQQPGAQRSIDSWKGISVISLGERTAEHWPRPLRRFRYAAMGRRTCEWLKGQKHPPSAVILYSGYSPYLLRLIPLCRRKNIPLIFDAVEWYEASGFLGSLLSPYQWNIEFAMRYLLKKTSGVIAISNYLASYYRDAGLPVLQVPPTLSVTEIPANEPVHSDSRLRLCYAGLPTANKDLLDVVVAAVLNIDKTGTRIKLHVAGPSERELLDLPSMFKFRDSLPPCIEAHGRIPQNSAMELVGQCDFTVLLRRDHRVSRAGFSTKFVESFAAGTPVIANITGDLGSFLLDGETGLICKGWSVGQLRSTLERALNISHDDLRGMRIRCRELALVEFDSVVHGKALASFVGSLAP